MAGKGPIPKPEAQRRRVNKPATPISHGVARGSTKPDADRRFWHPVAAAWFDSLAESGQSDYYEPSDWQHATYVAELLTLSLIPPGNAALVAQVQAGMATLLTSEGARRRLSLELDKATVATDDPRVAVMARYRELAATKTS